MKKVIIPCFDMTPNNINEEISTALTDQGFVHSDQLVFMQLKPKPNKDFKKDIKTVEVTQENAVEFVNIVICSNEGMDIDESVIDRKKHYFYKPNFRNFISYIGNEVAGIGSLFISGKG